MNLPSISQKELRLLQGLFVILVASGIVVRALDGGTLLASVVGGGVIGGLTFLPIALLFLVYLFGKQRSTQQV